MADEVRRIKRELVHKGAVLDIYCDTMQFENGNTAKWDFIHHDGAAAVVPVMDDGRLLMVRQYRNALERYTLELPAGKLDDPKEEGIVCAARELEEETGYRSDKLEWLITLRTTVAFCDERIEIFTAHDLIPTSQDIPDIPGMGTGILRRRNLPLLPAIGTDVLIAQIQAVWASLLLHASGLLSSASAPYRTLWVGPGRKCLFLIILYLSHSCKIFARFPAYFLSRNSALFRANSCIGKTKSLRKIHSEGLCFVEKISELLLLPASF